MRSEMYEKIDEEIKRMKKDLEHIESEATRDGWDLPPKVEDEITIIGRTMAVIEFLKGD